MMTLAECIALVTGASRGLGRARALALAKEVAAKGMTVNAVAPGCVAPAVVTAIPEKTRSKLLDQIPMQRFGTSEEVARSCIDLCLADEDYMTGSELKIHGGLYM